MAKYSYEQRMRAVLDITEKHMSYKAVAKILGCNSEVVRHWLKRYERFGIQGLTLKHGTYAGEFKQNVVEYMHRNHLSIFEAATFFGIPSKSTVGKWERIYYEEGPEALYRDGRGRIKSMTSKKPKKQNLKKETEEDLIAEVQRLRMENAYLKKLNALVQERIAQESGKKQPPSTN